jgi:DNA polymerase-3 subunit delta'
MADLVLHPSTEKALQQYLGRTTHAILLVGPPGSGKRATAQYVAAGLLGKTPQALELYPYLTTIAPVDGKAIPIDSVRELQKFMTLKIPGSGEGISRLAIIEDAHLMTTEAQNALLKTLEEPPLDTVLIMTATSPEALLKTIRSRVRALHVIVPPIESLTLHFQKQNFSDQDIQKALLVSGGLPGLTTALLTAQETHPLYEATQQARTLLQAKAYDRLLLVDGLSKQKSWDRCRGWL